MNQSEIFKELNAVDVSSFIEKKKQGGEELSYISWSNAWGEFKRRCPDAKYTVWKNPDGLPYTYDAKTGYMVYTSVTVGDVTHEMWLPVMDSQNKAMKAEPYSYETKYKGKKTVEAATMFDINKTIMRCLTKNLAMFGLGLYIYSGEDIPEGDEGANPSSKPEVKNANKVVCSRCGKELKPYIGEKTGKVVTVEQHVEFSKQRYNAVVCADCIKNSAKKKVDLEAV